VAIGVFVVAAFQIPEHVVDVTMRTGAEQDELAAVLKTIRNGIEDK